MLTLGFPVLNDPAQSQVHASTLLLVGSTLYVAWFGGSREGAVDTQIWFSTITVGRDRKPTADGWTEPRVLASQSGLPHWNPVLFKVPNHQRISLFYKVGSPISQWWTRVIDTTNKGRTWSEPRELVRSDSGGRGPVKNKLLNLGGSEVLAPASLERPNGEHRCFVDRSPDGGITWMRSAYVPMDESWPEDGATEPTLIRATEDGACVSMFCRSSSGYVARADSEDRGRTWSPMYHAPLFNNNSGIDAVGLERGDKGRSRAVWLIVHNPVSANWGPRTPLIISSSLDQGQTWEELLCLEDRPPPPGLARQLHGIATDGRSEFSDPAIISDGKGGVYVSYTYERRGIKVIHVDADEIP